MGDKFVGHNDLRLTYQVI